jgi:hypothetical protein
MKKAHLVAVAVALIWGATAWASDPVGIFALVEKVVPEPNAQAPERVQVWGVFELPGRDGESYTSPARGYLYFGLTPGQEQTCRREWADLQRIAGTGQCVGFGSRYRVKAALRKADEKPSAPDAYPVEMGLVKISSDSRFARDLRSLPAPLSPAEGQQVAPGEVTLSVQNIPDQGHPHARYRFEIEDGPGHKEASPAVDPGPKETKWTPHLRVQAGAKYTWRVWVADADWKGPVQSTVFQGKAAP